MHQTTNWVRSCEVGQKLLRGQFIEHKVKVRVRLAAPRLTRRHIDRTCSQLVSSTCSLCTLLYSCCCWYMKFYYSILHSQHCIIVYYTLNIGLATAYHRAQNRQAWSKLVGTATSASGQATWWWWWYDIHTRDKQRKFVGTCCKLVRFHNTVDVI